MRAWGSGKLEALRADLALFDWEYSSWFDINEPKGY